jgi:4-amino-4-deoxy-L-arabinose transferase-like glycosyltransferase
MTHDLNPERRRAYQSLAVVLVASFGLNLFPLWWGLPALNAWAFDEIRPEAVVEGLEQRFSDGWSGPYPPFHYYLLGALFWPVVWAGESGRLALEPLGQTTLLYLLGRFLSAVLATATVYLVYRCARQLGDRPTAVLSALVAATIPPFVFHAKTINLEAPYLFWFMLSVLFLLRILDRHRLRDYLCFAATATLAICTKDQAFAFYVLVPLLLWLDLHRHRRGEAGDDQSLWRTLLDRRLVVSALAVVALFVIVQNLLFNFEGFRRHLWLITQRSPSLFKLYEPTIGGYLALTLQSLRHLVFALGLPLMLAAVWGVARALRHPRQNRKMLMLLGLGLSYYLFFVMVIRHNYVRFLLPIALLLSFFAARTLMEIWRSATLPRAVATLLVGGILLHAFLRALSVDGLMHWDSRYRIEAWVTANVSAHKDAVAVGRQNLLPRGLEIVPWSRVRQRGAGYFAERGVDYLLLSTDDLTSRRRREFYALLSGGELGFVLAHRDSGEPPLNLLDTDGIHTNLKYLNPEIEVYRRAPEPAAD